MPALPRQAAPYARLVLLGITDRDGALQVAAARDALAADPLWVERAHPWRDARRGFEARIFDRAGTAPPARSGVADRSEGVGIGGAHHGCEQP
jgi:hypothetical protein